MTDILAEPSSVSSSGGVLETSIRLSMATISIGGERDRSYDLTTRTFNGTLPGPTLRVKPGDKLIIDFFNDLPTDQNLPYIHNEFSAPDESNLHFHGLHVSGELPSDDGTYVIPPGQSYRYMTNIPADHMPGTHWLHPHRHGSTALQVGGGAAAAIIVEDIGGDETGAAVSLPPQVRDSREVILVIQEMNLMELLEIASESGDSLLQISAAGGQQNNQRIRRGKFFLVNGQRNPTIPLQPGEWIRLRIIYAGWLEGALDVRIPGCEMQLIAKDGIYLRDLPRNIDEATLVNAGRADIMVRCMELDSIFSIVRRARDSDEAIATLETSTGPAFHSTAIEKLATPIQYPTYLADLRDTPATPGCSCPTEVDDLLYSSPTEYVHTTFPGAIVERSIEAERHPYHQHVHPFQLISGFRFGRDDKYYKPGDWHDTIQGDFGVIRYMPTVFTGKVMIHCHILTHEDEGMMGIEYINATGNTCQCGAFDNWSRDDWSRGNDWSRDGGSREQNSFVLTGLGDDGLPVYVIVVVAVAVVLLITAVAMWFFLLRTGRCNKSSGGSISDPATDDEDDDDGEDHC